MIIVSQKQKLVTLMFGLVVSIGLAMFSAASLASAQNSPSNYVPSGKVEDDSRGGLVQCGNKTNDPCTVEDIFNVFIIATNLLIGVVGLITIFSVFRAAWLMVTSSGNTEGVSEGKKQLSNALVGMVLVFLAAILVNVVIYGLAGAKPGSNIFNPLEYIGVTSGGSSSPSNNTPSTNGP